MFIFYEFIPFLYRLRARYLSKNTVFALDGTFCYSRVFNADEYHCCVCYSRVFNSDEYHCCVTSIGTFFIPNSTNSGLVITDFDIKMSYERNGGDGEGMQWRRNPHCPHVEIECLVGR